MTEWVVMRRNERDDSYHTIYVNVEADSAEKAIEEAVLTKSKDYTDTEGDYIAFPNEHFQSYYVKIKRVAEIELSEPVDMV